MISSSMMSVLIVFYLIIAFTAAYEGHAWRALYWVAASLLTVSVLKMT